MTTTTILLLVLSLIIAGGLSFYQYLFKTGKRTNTQLLLAGLRFVSIFGLLLLLINPVISRSTYETQKTPLPIAVDNSASVKDLKADNAALEVYRQITTNSAIKDKFDIQSYQFDNEFETSEIFDFKGKQTNIDEAATNIKSINKNRTFPTI